MIGRSAAISRHGFTLVEMLVVIAIIAVLMGLAAGTYFLVIGSTQASRTEDALRIIDKSLHEHWNKVVEEAKKDQVSPAVLNLANGDTNRARVLWIMFRLTEAFPQSYAEVRSAMAGNGIYGIDPVTGMPWIPTDQRRYMSTYWTKISAAGTTNTDTQSQSSICLYLSLIENRGGLKFPEDQLKGNVGPSSDGLNQFIDSWGKPLMFIRFPIGGNISQAVGLELAGMNTRSGTKARFGDPIDPDGTLVQTVNGKAWYLGIYSGTTTNAQVLVTLCSHPFPAANASPPGPQPYYVPFVTSNGADGTYGTGDDILSYRLRIGARGD
jgi:prepilin-type N-terminal cleavage/methylation domain-containing protein